MTTTTVNHRQPPPTTHQHYYSTTPSYFTSTSSSRPSVIKGCICCIFLLFSLLALLTLAVFLIIILAVKPKKPHFDLHQVTIQSLVISGDPSAAPGGGAALSLSIRLLFTASNPNTVGIKYGVSHFTVMYRGIPLGRASLPSFYQPQHSVRTVETVVTVDRVNLMQADASDLVKDASVYDKVELRVLGDVSAKIRIVGLDSPSVQVSVDCALVISPRRQELVSKQCGFDGFTV